VLEARDNGLGQRVAGFSQAVSQAIAVTFAISVVEATAVAAGARRIGRLVFHREDVCVLARFLSCAPVRPSVPDAIYGAVSAFANDFASSRRRDGVKEFDNLTVFCAQPTRFDCSRHDRDFEKKDRPGKGLVREHAKGIRLTPAGRSGEFVSVFYPGGEPPLMKALAAGVRVGGHEVLFGGGPDDDGPSVASRCGEAVGPS